MLNMVRNPVVSEKPSALFEAHEQTTTSKNVGKYFETSGFSRWAAIYGDGQIPPIWNVIREGHSRLTQQVMNWIGDDAPGTALDAGCGTGVLSLKLADRGYRVEGFDLSAAMVSFARYMTHGRTKGAPPEFYVGDIAAVAARSRTYELVCCLDVLFHYPLDEAKEMVERLSSLSTHKFIASFALRTPFNAFMMAVGKKFFHKKNRMTNLFLLSYDEIEQTLYRAGFRVTRAHRVKRFFYDSYVFEAVRT